MKTKLTLFVMSSSLVLLATALLAQNTYTNTNTLVRTQTVKYQAALENDRSLGERCLLSAGVKNKLMLTSEQKTELKPIEKDFVKTSQEYQAANQPRIDAAPRGESASLRIEEYGTNSGCAQPVATGLGRTTAIQRGSGRENQTSAATGASRGAAGSQEPMARDSCC